MGSYPDLVFFCTGSIIAKSIIPVFKDVFFCDWYKTKTLLKVKESNLQKLVFMKTAYCKVQTFLSFLKTTTL